MTGRLWLAGAFAALGMFAQGCVDNGVSFNIIQSQVPTAGGTTGCLVGIDPTSTHRNEGILDLSVATRYIMYPLYMSEIIASQGRVRGRPEARGLFVDGADIELSTPGAMAPAFRYRVISTTYVPPASPEGAGFATGTLEILPDAIGAQLAAQLCVPDTTDVTDACPVPIWPNDPAHRQQLIATIRPFGHTMGQVQVSSEPFVYPITLCCHCLVQFQSASDNPSVVGPDCNSSMGSPTISCNPGQDDPLDCRTCALGNPAACQPRGYQNFANASCPL
jgi:hypothetical protein